MLNYATIYHVKYIDLYIFEKKMKFLSWPCIIQVGRDKWVWARKVLKPGNWYLWDFHVLHSFIVFKGPFVYDVPMKKKLKCCTMNYEWSWMGKAVQRKMFYQGIIIFVVLLLPIALSSKAPSLKKSWAHTKALRKVYFQIYFKWAFWPFFRSNCA